MKMGSNDFFSNLLVQRLISIVDFEEDNEKLKKKRLVNKERGVGEGRGEG